MDYIMVWRSSSTPLLLLLLLLLGITSERLHCPAAATVGIGGAPRPGGTVDRMNVLFLVVDDLRPALGIYGSPGVSTPNMDRLAGESAVFTSAYTQQAVCAPSRVSFLTGRRPDTTRLYDFYSYWRDAAGNFTTLPQHFKENGYFAASIGKVFHPGIASNHTDDYPLSWSVPAYHPPTQKYKDAKMCPGIDGQLHMYLLCPIHNISAAPGGSLPDIESADYAVDLLQEIHKNSPPNAERPLMPDDGPVPREPFFVGLGFHKPHVPFKFPAEFLDLYPLDKVAPPSDPYLPAHMPAVAYEPWTSLRRREDVAELNASFPFGPLPADFQLKIRQHYHAAASYSDAMLGRVLDELDALGLSNRTIVTLIGDHGWALGEHTEWAKFNNFEVGVRVPMIVRVPGVTDGRGGATFRTEFVELVDMFPTVAQLAGLPVPRLCPENSGGVELCTEGRSFAPLLLAAAPSEAAVLAWKAAAFSQYPRPADYPREDSDLPRLANITIMGYTMRTRDYRYTEWASFDRRTFAADWSVLHGTELYLHAGADVGENANVAADSRYAAVAAALSKQLRSGWRAALPPE